MRSTLTLKVDDRDLQNRIRQALVMLGPTGARGLLSAIGHALRRSTLDKFKEEGDGEQAWAPLQDSTIRRRRKGRAKRKRAVKGSDGQALASSIGTVQILQDRGTLKRSISSVADAQQVMIGTDLYYGVFHQEGTEHMPARPFLTIADRDRRALATLTDKYLQRVFP